MARLMLSCGILTARAARTAARRRGLPSASPPPARDAAAISRISLVNILPRLASAAAFLCLIVLQRECPDIALTSGPAPAAGRGQQQIVPYPRELRGGWRQKRSPPWNGGLKVPATTYSSTPITGAVPSALEGLTAVFGMGTGVTPPLQSPGKTLYIRT